MAVAVSFIRKYYNLQDGPSDLDLDEAEEAIIEMQFVYDLRAADVSKFNCPVFACSL